MTDEFGNKPSGGQRTYKGMWRIQGMKESLDATAKSTLNQQDLESTTKTDKISLNEQCIWEGIGII